MFEYSSLWESHMVPYGHTLALSLGALELKVYRSQQEWCYATDFADGMDARARLSLVVGDMGFDPELAWNRLILWEKTDTVRFQPLLPDRPIIVRPEMPMRVMPGQSVLLFIGIPLWLSLVFGARKEHSVEVSSLTLSNSWFGNFTEGELCYALKTRAKLLPDELTASASRVMFPLEIRNASSENLDFQRLCVRPQFLNIFQGKTRLWTSRGRVSYRGEEKWSRIVYASGAPEFDEAGMLIGHAREKMTRGLLFKTFDSLKPRVEF